MRICLVSDTHGLHDQVELPKDCDLLIHAGDLTPIGRIEEIVAAGAWLREQTKYFPAGVVTICGNHDWLFQRNRELASQLVINDNAKMYYLEDSMIEIQGLKIYGSPWQPSFFNWAFNLGRGEAIKRKWDLIPENIDILITHGPPMGILDQSFPHLGSEHLGCEELMAAVERVKPRAHVFGHIHGGAGKAQYVNTLFINASICDERYQPCNLPIVIELDAIKEKVKES